MTRRYSSSDLTTREWAILAPLIPPPQPGGRSVGWERRERMNAIFSVLRSGCTWRARILGAARRATTGGPARLRPLEVALDRGANVWLVGEAAAALEGLRILAGDQRGLDLPGNEPADAQTLSTRGGDARFPLSASCLNSVLAASQTGSKPRSRQRTPNNRTTANFRISDDLWAVLEPLLPIHLNTHRFGGGRPRVPDRTCADAIFFVLRTGCQWRALDQTELCPHSTAHDRFQVWVEAGVFLQLWKAGVERFDELCGIEWDWLAMDGAITKAPLGGKKTGPNPTDRGKSGVKRSLLTEGHGVPIGLVIEGANRHDMKLTRPTVESLVVERPEPSEERPQGMCLDAGYDYDEVYELLQEFGFTAHVRPRGEEAKAIKHIAGFKARRWVMERAHSWMNRFRRLLIRWDKKPENYLAFLHFACGLIAFRAAGVLG